MDLLGIFVAIVIVLSVWTLCIASARAEAQAEECLKLNLITASTGVFRRSENETLESYCIDYTGTSCILGVVNIKQGQKFEVFLNDKWLVVSLIMLDNTYFFETDNELIAIPKEKLSAKIII